MEDEMWQEEPNIVPFWPPGDFTMDQLGFHDGQPTQEQEGPPERWEEEAAACNSRASLLHGGS